MKHAMWLAAVAAILAWAGVAIGQEPPADLSKATDCQLRFMVRSLAGTSGERQAKDKGCIELAEGAIVLPKVPDGWVRWSDAGKPLTSVLHEKGKFRVFLSVERVESTTKPLVENIEFGQRIDAVALIDHLRYSSKVDAIRLMKQEQFKGDFNLTELQIFVVNGHPWQATIKLMAWRSREVNAAEVKACWNNEHPAFDDLCSSIAAIADAECRRRLWP